MWGVAISTQTRCHAMQHIYKFAYSLSAECAYRCCWLSLHGLLPPKGVMGLNWSGVDPPLSSSRACLTTFIAISVP